MRLPQRPPCGRSKRPMRRLETPRRDVDQHLVHRPFAEQVFADGVLPTRQYALDPVEPANPWAWPACPNAGTPRCPTFSLVHHRPRAADPPWMKMADSLDPSAPGEFYFLSRQRGRTRCASGDATVT